MKKKKYFKNTWRIFLLLIVVSFTIYQSIIVQEKQQFIVGNWVCESTPEWKLQFTNNSECFWFYEGNLKGSYTYVIESEHTPNGVEIPFLKLTKVNNLNEVLEYEIIGLGNEEMYLDYLGDMGTKLIQFIKQ